jgi:hypothetical protein
MEAASKYTVCALFFGDYPELARRLVDSISRPVWRQAYQLRVGLHSVSEATRQIVAELKPEVCLEGGPPYYKYPMMRRLFYETPLTTPRVMWFDDDSTVRADAPDNWFELVEETMQACDMAGKMLFCPLLGKQPDSIRAQPWYTGRPVVPRMRVYFCAGSWWVTHTELLQKHDWPMRSLEHRGGDVMTGMLCYQQQYRMANFEKYVWSNANHTGVWNTSPRRGADQTPWGVQAVKDPS